MDVFLPCYTNAFPIKSLHVRDAIKIKWIIQGIKISSKRMQLLDNQRKMTVMEKKRDLEYIEQYRKMYIRIIQEANRRENNNYISSSKNKSKASWRIINKETGKSFINNKNIELRREKYIKS